MKNIDIPDTLKTSSFTPSVEEIVFRMKIRTTDSLDLEMEAFLSFLSNFNENDCLNYIENETPKDIERRIFQVYRHLLCKWESTYGTEWASYRMGTSHFIGNFMQRAAYFTDKENDDIDIMVRILRFLSALVNTRDLRSLFEDAKERYENNMISMEPWLYSSESLLKIS